MLNMDGGCMSRSGPAEGTPKDNIVLMQKAGSDATADSHQ